MCYLLIYLLDHIIVCERFTQPLDTVSVIRLKNALLNKNILTSQNNSGSVVRKQVNILQKRGLNLDISHPLPQ